MCFRSTKWARVLRRGTWLASATITWSWTCSATGRTWTPRYSASRAPSFQSSTVRYSPFSYFSYTSGALCLQDNRVTLIRKFRFRRIHMFWPSRIRIGSIFRTFPKEWPTNFSPPKIIYKKNLFLRNWILPSSSTNPWFVISEWLVFYILLASWKSLTERSGSVIQCTDPRIRIRLKMSRIRNTV